MATEPKGVVVDADGHVLEPGDMYEQYIDPQYRDRALRIQCDENGYENLFIDNKPYRNPTIPGRMGAIGGIGMVLERFPSLSRTEAPIRWIEAFSVRGPKRLPLICDAAPE